MDGRGSRNAPGPANQLTIAGSPDKREKVKRTLCTGIVEELSRMTPRGLTCSPNQKWQTPRQSVGRKGEKDEETLVGGAQSWTGLAQTVEYAIRQMRVA